MAWNSRIVPVWMGKAASGRKCRDRFGRAWRVRDLQSRIVWLSQGRERLGRIGVAESVVERTGLAGMEQIGSEVNGNARQEREVFFDLIDCILAARNAAESARKLAVENPSDAARHEARSAWYLERVRQWTQEMERTDA